MIQFTVTIPLWVIWAYLAIGVALILPLEYRYYRTTAGPRAPFWTDLRLRWKRTPRRWLIVPLAILLWPWAVWQEFR